MVKHLVSAVHSELAANGADLDLLVKLNAGALEKYDKMDKSLKSWSLLGEVRFRFPLLIHTIFCSFPSSFPLGLSLFCGWVFFFSSELGEE